MKFPSIRFYEALGCFFEGIYCNYGVLAVIYGTARSYTELHEFAGVSELCTIRGVIRFIKIYFKKNSLVSSFP